MYEKLNKEKFTEKAISRIELRKQMAAFRKTVFVCVLNKFDGKVYNKRFRDALMKEMPNELWYVTKGYNCVDEIKIVGRISKYNYSDTEDLYIKLVLNENGRIKAAETLENGYTCSWLNSFEGNTESIEDAVKNYDVYLQKAKELDKMIEDYGKKIPHYFRDNISNFPSYLLR